jgi:BON domain
MSCPINASEPLGVSQAWLVPRRCTGSCATSGLLDRHSPRRVITKHRLTQGLAAVALILSALPLEAGAQQQVTRTNAWSDPFLNVTHALPDCPVPAGPLFSPEEVRADSHWRAQRGVSCYLSGRCRLSNSYLYDKEIIPRVKQFILTDGRFDNSSIWVMGQRRWVWLIGCVASDSDRQMLELLVKNIDDVEAVVNQLMVGDGGKPEYEVISPLVRSTGK